MTIRSIAGATALLIAFSTAAFAATAPKMTGAEACSSLEGQFSTALPDHMKAKHLKTAQRLEAQGTKFCVASKFKQGEADLRLALHDIGVKPTA